MRALLSRTSIFACGLLVLSFVACGGGGSDTPPGAEGEGTGTGGNGSGTGTGDAGNSSSLGGSGFEFGTGGVEENPCVGDNPDLEFCRFEVAPSCGDGELNQDSEVCDDGNTLPGDGCNGICKVELNYICTTPGEPCELTFECGNGIREPGEVCDDANAVGGDGCNETCEVVDPNYFCAVAGQPCERIVFCGDGRIGGDETCEDDDSTDALEAGDGCDTACHVEPGWVCSFPGQPCEPGPRCGDGMVTPGIGEGCDDGNAVGGDGCAADCSFAEQGYLCATPGQPCENQASCGDGRVTGAEQCDDADDDPNDGCDACTVTEGWACPFPGAPCLPNCGDGINLNNAEICDDGNVVDGDGCSSTCDWEDGFACTGEAGHYTCVTTVCGDGIRAGRESCDDGNTTLGDGCTPLCQVEPNCEAGACTSACGDGLVLGAEQCDDGNNRNGDGCSESCQVELGSECEQPELGASIEVPVVYHDFDESHPDFEPGAVGCEDPTPGLVEDTLGADGKPVQAVLSSDACSRATALNEWYSDSSTNTPVVDTLTLWLSDDGTSYVNRYGASGEPYVATIDTGDEQGGYGTSKATCDATCTQRTRDSLQCENVCRPSHDLVDQTTRELTQELDAQVPDEDLIAELEAEIVTLEEAAAACDADCVDEFATREAACQALCMPCSYNAAQWCIGGEEVAFDGNPLFFPIDGKGQTPAAQYVTATVPDPVYFGNWQDDPSGQPHNFHFTSEVRFWFSFDASPDVAQVLNFTGDDDVWVFINNRLAVDLGGIHMPVEGAVNITQSGTQLGLADGNVYEIVVFQAERQTTGSSYRLTLSGFNAAKSKCGPICGDAVISPGEQCDEGDANNVGGYNHCSPDCERGEYCGDGVVQDVEGEQCDDGVNLTPYGSSGCAPGCVAVPYCGDSLVQGAFGERCDDGVNDGSYGGCTATCELAGFCGNGVTDADFGEQCDDGLNNGVYNTCAEGCVLGPRCGDGVLQAEWGEVCDDGNLDAGDGCSPTCTDEGICGDGIKDDGEQCDDGTANNDGRYGGCAPDCTYGPRCGDSVPQPEEEDCDGGESARVAYGECAPGCVLGPRCGDGTVQTEFEECDDANDDNTDNCSNSCKNVFIIPI